MLHVRGYANGGFCFMMDDKAVSVQEALLMNGRRFHKRTINALNRKNLPSVSDLKSFEVLAKILHTGLDVHSAKQVLRNNFNIDVMSTEYLLLTSSQVEDLKKVYAISRYRVPRYTLAHSPMYYFFRYLQSTK